MRYFASGIKIRRECALIIPLCAVMACGGVGATETQSRGMEKRYDDPTPPLTVSFTWHDGDQERQVWLDPELVAEFSPSSAGENKVKQANPQAQPLATGPRGIRLWRMMGGIGADSISRRMNTAAPHEIFSPVLHDAASNAGPMRLLPGNVIVHLNPAWNQGTIQNWLNAKKLVAVEQLEFGPNIFLIKTGAGLEALETANRIYESGEVVAAYPNWWVEMHKK